MNTLPAILLLAAAVAAPASALTIAPVDRGLVVEQALSQIQTLKMEMAATEKTGPEKAPTPHTFGFSKSWFGLDAEFGARAASLAYVCEDGTTYKEDDELRLYAFADGRAFDLEARILDAEISARRIHYLKGVFEGCQSTDNVLRLRVGWKTYFNLADPNKVEVCEPIARTYFLGGEGSVGIAGYGVDVAAGIGAEADLSIYAMSWTDANPKTHEGGARIGGILEAYGFAKAYGSISIPLIRVTAGGVAKIMDTAVDASVSASARQLSGRVDLTLTSFTVKIKLVLEMQIEVSVKISTGDWWKPWEWRIELRWVEIGSLTLLSYTGPQYTTCLLNLEF